MSVTHRILRVVPGVEHYPPGTLVDTTGWRTTDKLEGLRYIVRLTDAEIAAHEATKAANTKAAKTEGDAVLAARQAEKNTAAPAAPPVAPAVPKPETTLPKKKPVTPVSPPGAPVTK